MPYCKDNNFSTLSDDVFAGNGFADLLFSLRGRNDLESLALRVFKYQLEHNVVYREYVHNLRINTESIVSLAQIPFLPISFFKSHKIVSTNKPVEATFESSGTTGQLTSKHYVPDVKLYHDVSKKIFEEAYGSLKDFIVIGLLPSYLERQGSSLVEMVNYFIGLSNNELSGFYLNDFEKLRLTLELAKKQGKRILVIGVTFALLDFAKQFPFDLKDVIVMETGGMKGRKKEMVRGEVHAILKDSFNLKSVHSEYGMTELLSQCYAKSEGKFIYPPWVNISIRDADDPLSNRNDFRTGGINIIDIANINSCCFIATQDLGKLNPDGTFEVLGRFDNSDIRGCSLMVI